MNNFEHDKHRPTPVSLWPNADIPKWVWLAPAIALAIAVLPLPYGYYMGLRWFVTGTAIFLAWKEYELNQNTANSYTWIFGAIALLYNPIFPVHLFKLLWVILNIGTAAIFLGHYRLRLQNA